MRRLPITFFGAETVGRLQCTPLGLPVESKFTDFPTEHAPQTDKHVHVTRLSFSSLAVSQQTDCNREETKQHGNGNSKAHFTQLKLSYSGIQFEVVGHTSQKDHRFTVLVCVKKSLQSAVDPCISLPPFPPLRAVACL